MEDKKTKHELMDKIKSFKDQPFFVFIYKKTQRISSAVYMITEFFPEKEPLKTEIRSSVLELLSVILKFQDPTLSPNLQKNFSDSFIRNSIKVISFCEIGLFSKLISEMNFQVLEKEFRALIELVESQKNTPENTGNQVILGLDFFSSDLYIPPQKIDSSSTSLKAVPETSHSKNEPNNKEYFYKGHTKGHKGHSNIDFKTKTNRQDIILELIKKNKEVSIKDISLVVKDCSEKTIQRELLALVEKGILRKIGERRWSKYSML